MRSKIDTQSEEAEKAVRDIRRATRRHFSAEDKVRIVIAGLRGEDSVAELCRKEGINQNLYYRWSKDFLEAGKKRLAGDTARRNSRSRSRRATTCSAARAQCNACHRDGGPGEDPLFTDFTASNIGTPPNPRLPYYRGSRPDALGYVADPAGSSSSMAASAVFSPRDIRSAGPPRWMRDG